MPINILVMCFNQNDNTPEIIVEFRGRNLGKIVHIYLLLNKGRSECFIKAHVLYNFCICDLLFLESALFSSKCALLLVFALKGGASYLVTPVLLTFSWRW